MLFKVLGVAGIKALAAILALVFNAQIARNLGLENAGYFFILIMWLEIASSLSRFGLDHSLVKVLAKASLIEGEKNSYFAISLLVSVFLGLMWSFILYLIFPYFSIDILLHVGLFNWVLFVLSFSVLNIVARSFQGRKYPLLSQLYLSILVPLIFLLAWFVNNDIGSISEVLELYLYVLIAVSLTSFLLYIKIFNFKFGYVNSALSELKASAIPLFGVVVVSLFAQWSGQLVLSINNESEDVAAFAIANRASMTVCFLLMAVNSVVAPYYSSMWSQKKLEELSSLVVIVNRSVASIGILLLFLIFMFSDYIMSLFGSELIVFSNILCVLSVGQFINMATGSVGVLLMMSGYEKVYRNITFLCTVIFLPLLLVLTIYYGILGAAIATSCFVASQSLFCFRAVNRHMGIRLF